MVGDPTKRREARLPYLRARVGGESGNRLRRRRRAADLDGPRSGAPDRCVGSGGLGPAKG